MARRSGRQRQNRPRVPRQPGEIAEKLRIQYGHLTRSAAMFDSGHEDEAPRLAATCRVLFWDTNQSTSIVSQLHALHSFRLPDTAILNMQMIAPGLGMMLVGTDEDGNEVALSPEPPGGLAELGVASDGPRWFAPLDGRATQRWLSLRDWLTTPAVRGSSGSTHTREDFIRVLSNQEGGAHVAPTVEAQYVQLQADTLGASVAPMTGDELPERIDPSTLRTPALNVVEASMRQIAHEAQRAIETHFSQMLS